MREFDYIIIGGGCAGLSLAYELEIHEKFKNKTLAIIEPRNDYIRDKTWSFWKVAAHNFEDCVKHSWSNFSVNIPNQTKYVQCDNSPYQSIDSGLFYEKITNTLKKNTNINFFKNINEISTDNSFIFRILFCLNLSISLLNISKSLEKNNKLQFAFKPDTEPA